MKKRTVERRNREWNEEVDEWPNVSDEVRTQAKALPPYAVYVIKKTNQNVFISSHYVNDNGKLALIVDVPSHINTHLHPSVSGFRVFGLKFDDLRKSEMEYWEVPDPFN